MKIDEKRIKKFAGSALLLTALTLGGSVAINEYTVNHNDMIGYKKVNGYTAYDVNNNNQPYQVSDTMKTVNPTIYFIPNIEVFKNNSDLNDAELVKELKLK